MPNQEKIARMEIHTTFPRDRLTLIKSTLTSIPIYHLSCFNAFQKFCSNVDRLMRKLWWNEFDSNKRKHFTNWNQICQPLSKGGLGIKTCKHFNQVLPAKQAQRIIKGESPLLKSTIVPLYCRNESFIRTKQKPSDNWVWKSILQGRDLLLKGLDQQLGDAKKKSFLG